MTDTGGVSRTKEAVLGRHFWAIGYGAWTTGNITDKMVDEYLEHHRKDKGSDDRMILE